MQGPQAYLDTDIVQKLIYGEEIFYCQRLSKICLSCAFYAPCRSCSKGKCLKHNCPIDYDLGTTCLQWQAASELTPATVKKLINLLHGRKL